MTEESPQLDDSEAWRAMSLSQRLQRLLAEQGLSQAELAKRTGIAVSTIKQLVTGARSPTLEQLDKLAMGLGIGLERLLALQPQAEPQAVEQRLCEAEARAADAQQGREELALQQSALVAELGEAVARESRLRDEVTTLGEELAEARRQLEALEPTREQAPAPVPDRSRGNGLRRCTTECSGLWRACIGAVSG